MNKYLKIFSNKFGLYCFWGYVCNTQKENNIMENLVEYTDQVLALAQYLSIDPAEVTENSYDYEAEGAEYLVLDDSEADQKWDEYMDQYIDDCILDQLPETYWRYFDSEKFKRDCSYDGRGHTLASYDGCENEERVNGTIYYIYRTN